MHLSILLDMAADGMPERPAFSDATTTLTYAQLRDGARAVAAALAQESGERTVFVGLNAAVVPLVLFASALAGTAFTPLNYRLGESDLRRIAQRAAPGVAIVDDHLLGRFSGIAGLRLVTVSQVMAWSAAGGAADLATIPHPDDIGVLLFTSGTTGEPKAAVLRHTHLASYVLSTLEFASADDGETALVSVPPYHIAGISAVVSSLYTGRHVVYVPSFTPDSWVDAVERHRVTHAMVVPTMLGRVLDVVESSDRTLPTLRHLSYGGGRMPVEVIERALRLLPGTNFVNAYGLTETSSTISVLGPDDHRDAIASGDPHVRHRLGSVGRPHSAIEVSIRDHLGRPVAPGERGEIWVRGEQVSGEYVGKETSTVDGWFPTNDGGWLDDGGYLYLTGRLDDVIVRGGENISPGEIEDVLRQHPAIEDVAVVGVPSTEWGEAVAAVVVTKPGSPIEVVDVKTFIRDRLRSTRVPETVRFVDALPYNETGKLLRRVIREELASTT